jgi:hypothetical protein
MRNIEVEAFNGALGIKRPNPAPLKRLVFFACNFTFRASERGRLNTDEIG